MYLTVKQQVKHLSKEDYKSMKHLCHIAKNLTTAVSSNGSAFMIDGRRLKSINGIISVMHIYKASRISR